MFLKKETLVQGFCCEFCEFFKNTFFYRTPPVAASVQFYLRVYLIVSILKATKWWDSKYLQKQPPEVFCKMFLERCSKKYRKITGKHFSGTGVFRWILRNLKELLFYRTPLGDCFCIYLRYLFIRKCFTSKDLHHIDKFNFKTFSKVRKASFFQFQFFKNTWAYLIK